MAKPRILELSPEGPGPAHWALWLLRTRTDPGMREGGHGHDRTGANTDGKHSVCRGCLLEAVWGTCPTPALPPPGPSLTLESLTQAQGCGVKVELWTEGGREACVRIHMRWQQERLHFSQARPLPRALFLSFFNTFSLPSAPKVGHHSLCAAEMGF